MDLRLIQEFSGDGSVNVIEWLEKAELVCALRGITRLEAVLPLRLTGGAFAVYQQLTAEDKDDSGKIKFALKTAFAVDAFTAYELFVARRLQPGETVDVYLAELRRLAVPFGGLPEKALVSAFVAGLPDGAKQLLRAGLLHLVIASGPYLQMYCVYVNCLSTAWQQRQRRNRRRTDEEMRRVASINRGGPARSSCDVNSRTKTNEPGLSSSRAHADRQPGGRAQHPRDATTVVRADI